ncbi:Hsp20/alpha crystallin family protein [Nesterenkonia sphaerica]|uniref:Hsp20/alpha crystallin family protein n=1 Tax=Nesterenkonia sphaerica TaxID=1804988 RepID=A0A5R9AAZ3_9MICC|nr:Hsp20/alpha crystallin family protein [Nesterenkonia sphaerica]TLP75818.1 Hsp20/alpha crystallin family protein [Nesterenkonia sphaerica]
MINSTFTRLDPFALVDDFLRQSRMPQFDDEQRRSGFVPPVDARREGEDLVASVDLPGVDPEKDISVELSNGGRTLTVSGERKVRHEAEGFREVRYGSFSRTMHLPEAVQDSAISADYESGVLTVRVAGVYAEERPQRIRVTSNAGSQQVGTGGQEAKEIHQ